MHIVGWVATIIVAIILIFIAGYWIGYKFGQHDRRDGVREP
jgi:hypothetical protein